ncbi:MAG TPA: hypothetical protein VIL46_12070 [Gemmataceae bacterium]
MSVTMDKVEAAVRQHGEWLMNQRGVRGFDAGLGSTGEPALRVYSDDTPEEVRRSIRNRVKVPVEFIEGFQVELR